MCSCLDEMDIGQCKHFPLVLIFDFTFYFLIWKRDFSFARGSVQLTLSCLPSFDIWFQLNYSFCTGRGGSQMPFVSAFDIFTAVIFCMIPSICWIILIHSIFMLTNASTIDRCYSNKKSFNKPHNFHFWVNFYSTADAHRTMWFCAAIPGQKKIWKILSAKSMTMPCSAVHVTTNYPQLHSI